MAFNFTGGTGARQRSSVAIAAVLLAISLICVAVYAREGAEGPLHTLQNATSSMFAPLKAASGAIGNAEEGMGQAITDTTADENSLTALRQQNQELRETIAQLEEYRQEAERLQGLLDIKDLYQAETITARVLSRIIDPWNLVVTIDKGTNDGIRAGLPVMGPSGLIGQVSATTATTSDVRLLQDPQSGVSVIVQSNRAEGIVRGNLDGLLYLEDVDEDAEIKAGDVVITSGLGGGYFSGLIVGTVSKVEGEVGTATRKIIIEPNTQAKPFEEVMVITAMHEGANVLSGESQTAASAQNTSTSATDTASTADNTYADTESYASGEYYDNQEAYYEEGSYA